MSQYTEGADGVGQPLGNAELEGRLLARLRDSMVWLDDVCASAKACARELMEVHGVDFDCKNLSAEEKMQLSIRLSSIEHCLRSKPGALFYELRAIVVHSGTAHAGHYYAYIRDVYEEGNHNVPVEVLLQGDSAKAESEEYRLKSKRFFMTKVPVSDLTPQIVELQATVDDQSPLAKVLMVMMADVRDEFSPATSSLQRLCEAIRIHTGEEWSKTYASRYGTLHAFLSQHSEFFEVEKGLVRLKEVRVNFVDSFQFDLLKAENDKEGLKKKTVDEMSSSFSQVQVHDAGSVAAAAATTEVVEALVQRPSEEITQMAEDEALARAIQDSERANELNGKTEANDDTKWITPKARSKVKIRGPGKVTSSSAAKHTSSPSTRSTGSKGQGQPSLQSAIQSRAATTATSKRSGEVTVLATGATAELNDVERALAILSHQLLCMYHGHFFEFNDTVVTPIPLAKLKQSFEGKDCAYLLEYRRVEANDVASPSSAASSRGARFVLPHPPPYWADLVARENSDLARIRIQHDLDTHKLGVGLFLSSQFSVAWPFLVLSSELNQINGACGNHISADTMLTESLQIQMDTRDTVYDLLCKLSRVLPPTELSNFGMSSHLDRWIRACDGSNNCDMKEGVVLSVLQRIVTGSSSNKNTTSNVSYFPLDSLHPTVVLGTLVTQKNTTQPAHLELLLWNGKDVSGRPFPSGVHQLPVKVRVNYLEMKYVSSSSAESEMVTHTQDMWLPANTNILQACESAAKLMNLQADCVLVHTMKKSSAKREIGYEKGLYPLPLVSRAKVLHTVDQLSTHTVASLSIDELILELLSSAQTSNTYLADIYVRQRNAMVQVKIEYDEAKLAAAGHATTHTDASTQSEEDECGIADIFGVDAETRKWVSKIMKAFCDFALESHNEVFGCLLGGCRYT